MFFPYSANKLKSHKLLNFNSVRFAKRFYCTMYSTRRQSTIDAFLLYEWVCLCGCAMHKQQNEKLATCRFVNSLVSVCRIFFSFRSFFFLVSNVDAPPTKKVGTIEHEKIYKEVWSGASNNERNDKKNKI